MREPNPETRERALDFFRRHRITKAVAELAFKLFISCVTWDKDHRESIKDPEQTRGMIEGSIIGYNLGYPNPETGEFQYKSAGAGEWLGFDFNRPQEFPLSAAKNSCEQMSEGRLWAILLEDVMDNTWDERTPTFLLNLFNLDHLFRYDAVPMTQLEELGLVRAVSYADAYKKVGLYEQYVPDLRSRGLEDAMVYQVTPKGNTLILLAPSFGEPSPKDKFSFESEPFGFEVT